MQGKGIFRKLHAMLIMGGIAKAADEPDVSHYTVSGKLGDRMGFAGDFRKVHLRRLRQSRGTRGG